MHSGVLNNDRILVKCYIATFGKLSLPPTPLLPTPYSLLTPVARRKYVHRWEG